jgi:hypothetical protein
MKLGSKTDLIYTLVFCSLGRYCLKPYRDMNPFLNSLLPLYMDYAVISIYIFISHLLRYQSKYTNTVSSIDLYFTPVKVPVL